MSRNLLHMELTVLTVLMTGRRCKVNNFIRGLVCDFIWL